jgi:hypothetical protein
MSFHIILIFTNNQHLVFVNPLFAISVLQLPKGNSAITSIEEGISVRRLHVHCRNP